MTNYSSFGGQEVYRGFTGTFFGWKQLTPAAAVDEIDENAETEAVIKINGCQTKTVG